ncbi:Malonyl-CoA decarboxylase [Macleaya cordata]|uniref:Malonyl-CoA decarboxylase n=1 Tax=Macleaya cordata TaxID=56857 RepID=A0A200QGW2_MACCD|nr:Malonyl-CoA decarboxylase [Macleaya cordata]
MSKTDIIDEVLNDFSKGFFGLSHENRRKLLLVLSREYDVSRTQVRELIQQYINLEIPSSERAQSPEHDEQALLSAFYRTERNLRHALQPKYDILFERLNTHPGGLKFLSILRADLLSMLQEENIASLRALDSYLMEKLVTWLSPAALELHQITWDDPASLLEKIVAYEAVHPISNLIDLKRRLGVGRRCFGYLHPAIPGEPLIFIEVALLKNVAQTIQEVLWDNPPTPESQATCALFYSISSTQPGLAGINLGKFLIKRVIELVKRDMPHITTFATLSPIPGYMQWLLAKLASQLKLAEAESEEEPHSSKGTSGSTFREDILQPEEERAILNSSVEFTSRENGMEVLLKLLTSKNNEWTSSPRLLSVLQAPLLRLCARYLLQEKKRGKALDTVANFHLQNGAMIERLNWMADRSVKGICQSGGIMVNYIYRLDKIEENARSYFGEGRIQASCDLQRHIEVIAIHDVLLHSKVHEH